jgi:endonuclease/exonuclease/phosphatase (EEP) superfamily protein YafD
MSRPAGSALGTFRWAALAAALAAAGCTRPAETPAGPHFTIMTYNVDFAMPCAEATVEAIASADADVVCLQETTPAWERLLGERLGGRYAHAAFRHGGAGRPGAEAPGRGAGLGVLSRLPFRHVAARKSEGAWSEGWVIEVHTPAGPVQVVNMHLRPPVTAAGAPSLAVYLQTAQTRRGEVEEFSALVAGERAAVVLGDFNEFAWGAAPAALREKGLASALARFDAWSDTWRWAPAPLLLHARIDHIFHSGHLRCLHARVIKAGGSDHWPVVATFEACRCGGSGE